MPTIQDLLIEADRIKNETVESNNTAQRIGSLFKSVIQTIFRGVISTDGSIESFIVKTKDEWGSMSDAERDPKTIYAVLDPDQEGGITQIITNIISDLDSKADAQAVAQSINSILTAIGTKANQQDLYALSLMLQTSTVQQDPDWHDVFTRNGSFVFVDDEHGMSRPQGFIEPSAGTQRKYNVNTWAVGQTSKPTADVRDMTTGNLYVLTLEEDGLISVQGLATTQEIGDINTILDALNGEVI